MPQQHGVAIAEEAVALCNGVLVQGHDFVVPCKSAYQHDQGALWQVEIGKQHIDSGETVAWRNEDLGIATALAGAGPAFQRTHAGGAYGCSPPP